MLLSCPCSLNVVIYAAVSVFAGSWRSVQVDPPEGKEIMTHKEAAKFPIVSHTICRTQSHMSFVQQSCSSRAKRGGRGWQLASFDRDMPCREAGAVVQ